MTNQNDWWEHKKNCALHHSGIKGMKWGVRRYQNKDGTLTAAGKKHYAGDENAGEGATAKTEYAPKRKGGKAEDYSDEELRARINRLQMEKQYRDLQGDTNIRADDPNRELKAEKERLQLQKDVKQLRSDVYGGRSFVKSVMKDAGKQFLTKAVAGAMSYSAKQFVTNTFENPDLANAIVSGSASGGQAKQDDKKN